MVLKNEHLLRLYRQLVLARAFEETMLELPKSVKLQELVHSGIGMEAVGIGTLTFLRNDDYVMATHRGYANKIGKGLPVKRILAELYGKMGGYTKGKDSHHMTVKELNFIGKWGLIGGQFPTAVGLGVAAQFEGRGQVCVIFFGDGCSNRGTFHEALNLASLWKLPIIWVCENNQYSLTTPIARHTAAGNIASYARSYRMPGRIVDGMDVIAVHNAVQKAVMRARKGEGPSLLDMVTYRFRPHNEGPAEIRPEKEINQWKEKDSVTTFKRDLMKKGILTEGAAKSINAEVQAEIAEAIRYAEQSPRPEPGVAFEDLFA